MQNNHHLMICACPDELIAAHLAEQLVKKQLAACVNIISNVTSVFRWENQVESAKEFLLYIKTIVENIPAIEVFIQTQHPYQVPEIIAIPIVAGADKYLQWISQSCRRLS